MLLSIFQYLDVSDLLICSQVCKTWRKIATDDTLWKKRVVDFFKTPPHQNYWNYLRHHSLKSQNDILEKIETFFKGVSFGKKGHFICHFFNYPDCKIEATLGYTDLRKRTVFEITCHSYLFKKMSSQLPFLLVKNETAPLEKKPFAFAGLEVSVETPYTERIISFIQIKVKLPESSENKNLLERIYAVVLKRHIELLKEKEKKQNYMICTFVLSIASYYLGNYLR